MTWKVFLMSIVGGLAVLLQFEVQNDILYVEKEVVLPGSRAKTFLFLSDLRNFKYVSVLLVSFSVSSFVDELC